MPFGTIVNSIEDTVAVILEIIETAQREVVFLLPPSLLSIGGTYDTVESARRFIQHGGVLRGITTVSPANVEEVQIRLDIGENLRHCDRVHEIFMVVGDKQSSISMINVGAEAYALDDAITAFWSENPVYAGYLLASFEDVWSQAISARQQIRELTGQEAGQD